MLSPFEWVILAFATCRLTRLLVMDDIMAWLRNPFVEESTEVDEEGETAIYIEGKGKGVQKWIGSLLSCYWCAGVWVATALYFGYIFYPLVFTPISFVLAIACVAALLESISRRL